MKSKLFYDSEFTGLHKDTTLISIGIISDTNDVFYAEFNDYDKSQVDDWVQNNVIEELRYNDTEEYFDVFVDDIYMKNNSKTIITYLRAWLRQFDKIEIWSDCLAYDWVLFCDLFGGALKIPENIYYIPFDICTLFKMKNIDPDIDRKEFTNTSLSRHNSLDDAIIIQRCYNKLMDL